MLIQILLHQPRMLGTIIQNTPPWVWALMSGLLVLGASQSLPRRAGPRRVALLPAAMAMLALAGLLTAFDGALLRLATTVVWGVALASFAAVALRLRPEAPAGTRFDARERLYTLPGSAAPLLLILAIFLTKYAVGVELALQPALVRDPVFALGVAALYGVFNGILAARYLRLRRLAGSHKSGPLAARA